MLGATNSTVTEAALLYQFGSIMCTERLHVGMLLGLFSVLGVSVRPPHERDDANYYRNDDQTWHERKAGHLIQTRTIELEAIRVTHARNLGMCQQQNKIGVQICSY
jgi:hypothetical protein